MKNIFIFLMILSIILIPNCKPDQEESSTTDPNRLLSDEELMTPEDPNAAEVKTKWAAWIKENYSPIRSLTASIYPDVQFLKPILKGRQIVQLGESGHGVKEFNQAKVRLIRFLHQEMGFDVIAFESCIFCCFYTNLKSGTMTALPMMQNSIYGVWHTIEVLKLFEFIKETQVSERPLILAGFDMKSSGGAYVNRPAFFRDAIEPISSTYAQIVYDFDREFVNETSRTWDEIKKYVNSRKQELTDFYQELVEFFDLNMNNLQNTSSQSPQFPLIARQEAWSIVQFIKYCEEGLDDTTLTLIRDSAMAENLSFLANTVYPGKKIIVWAHNFHIRHNGEMLPGYSAVRTMGSWIEEEFRPVLYTLGLYMYQGSAAMNDRTIYAISPPTRNSLEAICYQARCKFMFVDMLNQIESEGNSWMFTPIEAKSWGTNPISMVLRDQYDGILFIHTVNPPDYTSLSPPPRSGFPGL